jgi:hypothetical protein
MFNLLIKVNRNKNEKLLVLCTDNLFFAHIY